MTSASLSRRIGLARALSKLGYCSRSAAFRLIRAGRVRLNDAVRRDPEAPVHLPNDCIEVDGEVVVRAAKVYLMLNKPRGSVTTASDEKGRKTVYAFLSPDLQSVAPVGRLDKASEGLLLFSNDSEWSARVLAPTTQLEKIYHVQIDRIADSTLLQSIGRGTRASDGEFLGVKQARILRSGERNSWLEIVLDEGKNRHIRRMLKQLEIEVLRLVRIAIGPLLLGQLPKGKVRSLTIAEKRALDKAMQDRFARTAGSVAYRLSRMNRT